MYKLVVLLFVAFVGSSLGTFEQTMTREELIDIINSITESMDPAKCIKFGECEPKLPEQVATACKNCKKEIIPDFVRDCDANGMIFPDLEVPKEILQCIDDNTVELNDEEKAMVVQFEECVKAI